MTTSSADQLPPDPTLAQIIDHAARIHNDASGRRLAEIAQADGDTISHATINRLRAGASAVGLSRATIEALAHLARLDVAVVMRATAAAQSRGREAIERDYARLKSELLRITVEYADTRNIDLRAARAELDTAVAAIAMTTGSEGL